MRNLKRILLLIALLAFASGPIFAQHGHYRRHDGERDSAWSMRWHPKIGSHFGLSDSCWNIFLSELPADTAGILRSAFDDIRMNRAKIDTLHTEYRAARRAGDTAMARMIWVEITDHFGNIRDDWNIIRPIIRRYHLLLAEVQRDCSHRRGTVGIRVSPVVPNPASSNAHFSYTLTAAENVSIEISDQAGNRTKTVFSGNADAGEHEVRLDLSGMQSGVYLLRVQAGADVSTEKFVIRN